jgi:dethiobiotin synthetase
MGNKYFITGTDTAVGKTHIAIGLLQLFARHGFATIGLKPIASGGGHDDGELKNHDASQLQRFATMQLPYHEVNPFTFAEPIAPHIAAAKCGVVLSSQTIVNKIAPVLAKPADRFIIEGAGGWLLPLNEQETLADVVTVLNLEVILVVAMRLGCLNHALLSNQVISRSGGKLVGWVANCLDISMQYLDENIYTLKKLLPTPLLGVVPYNTMAVEHLDISLLKMTRSAIGS